ncbi:MAG TPA: septum formation initiator family protein [Candidatus Aphodovivens avistercoris]|nr:septum formation initiator family protein [Candidatus Aphodovivens avistercoris]
MARTATIVSFDDAKRSSRAARSHARRTSGRTGQAPAAVRPLIFMDPGSDARFTAPSRRGAQAASGARSRSAAPVPSHRASAVQGFGGRAAASASAFTSASASSSASASPLDAFAPSARRAGTAPANRAGRAGSFASPRRGAPSWYDGPDERALRDEQARLSRQREEDRALEEEEEAAEPATLRDRIRRAAAKRKADKLFGAGDGAPSGEGGPRAALYKGEMGSSQKRASRMQGSPSDERSGASGRKAGRFRVRLGSKLRIAGASVACLALVCVFLYQPAQQCYQAMRERDALAAEYSALQQREDALQSSVDALSTDAGMEELAHEQFGLVKKNEVAVSVSGVEGSSSAGSSIPPNVASGEVDPPDTWYSGVLDPLFGVK